MQLIIDGKNTRNTLKEFCLWLIDKMHNYISTEVKTEHLARFNAYLTNSDIILYNDLKQRPIFTDDILIGSAYNLIVVKRGVDYVIKIDDNVKIPHTNTKFIDIVKLINYGNTELKPYPIYTEMMDYFANNINSYALVYLKEKGVV